MIYDEVIIKRIKKAFDTEKMVFFVGAGISVCSKVPTFYKLNEEIIQTIGDRVLKKDECKFLSKDIRLRPEVVLQIGIEELDSRVLEIFETFLGPKKLLSQMIPEMRKHSPLNVCVWSGVLGL